MTLFVGPSYSLATYKASAQRSVNMHLVAMETPTKAQFILDTVPGLATFCDLGAEIRGGEEVEDRVFVVAGATLYEVSSAGVATNRGTLLTSTGPVAMKWGLTQLVIVDGPNGYVLRLSTNVFERITDPAFYGSNSISYLNGYFGFVRPDTQQAYISAIDDATSLNALDFVSAEQSPDKLVSMIEDHAQILKFGTRTTEVWEAYSTSSYPYQRSNGQTKEVGCIATHSIRKVDNSVFFLGRDANGSGIVYRLAGNQPIRVSQQAVEEAIQGSTDLSATVAWVYQERGLTFYAFNAPGLTSTWVYEVKSGTWHERCDLDEFGQFTQWRVNHCVFGHGKHLVGGDDGILYEMSREYQTFGDDVIVRERTSPHTATPTLEKLQFGAFVLDCTTGESPQDYESFVELSWSNDGGATYGNPVTRSLGRVGERFPRLVWRRLGSARNRVWRIRYSGTAEFSIIGAEVK